MRQMRLIRRFAAARRLLVVSALVLATAIGLATGCGSVRKAIDNANASAAAYSDLQGFIRDQLTTKFSRSVRSVSCTPHVDQVLPGDTADLTCAVVFTDGTSYDTPATITDPSTDPDIATESFSFNDPPAIDITTAPLPGPAVSLAATSPDSLLLAGNLAPVLRKLTARFGSQDLIVQMAIYPGEVEAVIAGNNGEARAVTATYTGALTAGSLAAFEGSRNGIDFSQLVPGVIQRLTELITTKGNVRLASISRFVLTNSLPGGNSGWTIYLTSGSTRFQALVLGNDPQIITPSGTHDLN
jgi:hypothetical protein